jgi:hypothetical protein
MPLVGSGQTAIIHLGPDVLVFLNAVRILRVPHTRLDLSIRPA